MQKQRRNAMGQSYHPPVSARKFVEVWQGSQSVAEVAAKVHRKKNAVRQRAFRYRRLGIPLKEFPPVEIELPDWDELAEYAASLLPADGQEVDDAPQRCTQPDAE
jgi:hypothetical protein